VSDEPPPNFRSLEIRRRLHKYRWAWLAAGGGAISGLSIPPTDLYPAVLVGLAVLAFTVARAPRGRDAFGRGVAWATAGGTIGLRFVPEVIQRFTSLGDASSYLALVLLAAAQSVGWGLGAWVTYLVLRRCRAPLELAFAAGVFVAANVPAVFVWTPAGVLSPWPELIQLADIVGERGVSALLAVSSALLARAGLAALPRLSGSPLNRKTAALAALSAVLVVGALWAVGVWRIGQVRQASAGLPTMKVGLVDQSIGPKERWEKKNHPRILLTLRDLTVASEKEGAELTIWPEAAYPYVLPHDSRVAPRGRGLVRDLRIKRAILMGYISSDPPVEVAPGKLERSSYNSSTLVTADGKMQEPQDKLQLLWFGETIPLGQYLPWLRRLFERSGGLRPGKGPRALELSRDDGSSVVMASLNCYEDTLPHIGRELGRTLRPNLLVNVTNDAWFVNTPEAELHHRLSVLRAVELRLDLVRAVNKGVTSWVDATGTTRARRTEDGAGILVVTPAIRPRELTLYARWGDWPMWLLFAAAALASWGRASWGRSRISRRPDPSAP